MSLNVHDFHNDNRLNVFWIIQQSKPIGRKLHTKTLIGSIQNVTDYSLLSSRLANYFRQGGGEFNFKVIFIMKIIWNNVDFYGEKTLMEW